MDAEAIKEREVLTPRQRLIAFMPILMLVLGVPVSVWIIVLVGMPFVFAWPIGCLTLGWTLPWGIWQWRLDLRRYLPKSATTPPTGGQDQEDA